MFTRERVRSTELQSAGAAPALCSLLLSSRLLNRERDVLTRGVVPGHMADELVAAGLQVDAEAVALAAHQVLALAEHVDRLAVHDLGGRLDDSEAVHRHAEVLRLEGDLAGLDRGGRGLD